MFLSYMPIKGNREVKNDILRKLSAVMIKSYHEDERLLSSVNEYCDIS